MACNILPSKVLGMQHLPMTEETGKALLLPKTERAPGAGTCSFGDLCLAL